MFDTPILYIVFNRIDTVKKTFPEIRKVKPKFLYIAADGPRKDKKGEEERCLSVRKWVLNNIDWDCDVHTLFSQENLGCKYGVSNALKWFFSQEEQGIIMEDDIYVIQTFFHYCEYMLNKFKDDNSIGVISGFSIPKFIKNDSPDFFLSTYCAIWGWATWRRVIMNYTPDYASLMDKKRKDIRTTYLSIKAKKQILKNSLNAALSKIDTWDYQFEDYIATHNMYSVCPKKSLVRNVGFIADSTHTPQIPKWYTDEFYDFDINENGVIKLNKHYSILYEKTNLQNGIKKFLAKITILRYLYHKIKRRA